MTTLFRAAGAALLCVLLVLLVSIAPPEAGAGNCYTTATTYATQTYATPVYAVSYIPLQIPTYSTGYGNPNEALEKEVKGLREELKALVAKPQQPAPPVQVPQPMPPGYPPPQSYLYPPAGFQQGYYQQPYQQPYGYPPQQPQAGYYAPQPQQGYYQPQQPPQQQQQPAQQDPQQQQQPAKDGGPQAMSYLQVFQGRCASCHDAATAKEKGNGFVITEGGALAKGLDAKQVMRIVSRCHDGTMPPAKAGRPLDDKEYAAVMAWVSNLR